MHNTYRHYEIVNHMMQTVNSSEQKIILKQASIWLLQLEKGPLCDQKKIELKKWMSQSPEHRDAFRETVAKWANVDKTSMKVSGTFPLEKEMCMSMTNLDKNNIPSENTSTKKTIRFFNVNSIIAVTFLLFVVLGSYGYQKFLMRKGFVDEKFYTTQIGKTKQVVLDDGSTITLNTNTQLRVVYSQSQRKIDLIKGEAFFDVISDPQRAFVVNAGKRLVEAVGTAFSVYKKGSSVDVAVTEGAVQLYSELIVQRKTLPVDENQTSTVERVTLEQGQMVSFGNTMGVVHSVEPDVMAKKLIWQQGMLAFDGETLEEVIEEFSRYSPMTISIADESIRGVRVGGYFKSDDIKGMLNSLQYNFGINVKYLGTDIVKLEKAN